MKILQNLIDNNRRWAQAIKSSDPEFFHELSNQQTPKYLWIGCSDSRVPANQIVGLAPGEIFVHRNVANIVVHTDLNCLSVIQFAVEILNIEHIIVCGHYGCGGVQAAMGNSQLGLIDNWLRHIKDIYKKHHHALGNLTEPNACLDRLCELNVIEQVNNVCHTTIVQNAWEKGAKLSVHGLIYGINDGLIHDLNVCITNNQEIDEIYRTAASAV